MKYVVRRAIAGVVVIPAVASMYFGLVALLIGLGAEPNQTPTEVWNIGIAIGWLVEIVLVATALPKIDEVRNANR